MLNFKNFLLILTLSFLFLISTSKPQPVQAQTLAALPASDLATDIDNFVGNGAIAFLVWDHSWNYFRGTQVCNILADKATQYPQVAFGVNIFNLADKDSGYIRDALSYLSQNCGTTVVRIWGSNPGSTPLRLTPEKIQNALDISGQYNIKLIIAMADWANNCQGFNLNDIITPADHTNPAAWYSNNSYNNSPYMNHIITLLSRVGRHPALWGVELANEAHCNGSLAATYNYNRWVGIASALTRYYTNAHIGIGQMASAVNDTCDYPSNNFATSNRQGTIDVASGHFYTPEMRALVAEAQAISPVPFYVGEAGYNESSAAGSCFVNPFRPGQFLCDVYPTGDKSIIDHNNRPDTLSSPEYHSLRPYPTCPINPEIRDTTYYSCGNDLTATETLTLRHPDDPNHSGNPFGVDLIECVEDPTDVFTCQYTVNRNLPISINFDRSELPFLGLTRSPYLENSENDNVAGAGYKLDSGQKMNHYLSWYLNGTIDRAENAPLAALKDYPAANPDSSPEGYQRSFADTQELILYSGPLRKLEPWYIQNIHHLLDSTSREDQIIRANLAPSTQTLPFDHYTRRHDQIATCIIDMEDDNLELLHTIADFIIGLIFDLPFVPGDYQGVDTVTDFPTPCYVDPGENEFTIFGTFLGDLKCTSKTEGRDGDIAIDLECKLFGVSVGSIDFIRLKRIRLSGDGNDTLQQHGWDKDDKLPPDRENYDSRVEYFQALKRWYGEVCSPVFNLGIEFYFCFDEGETGSPDFINPNYWGTTYSYIPFSSTEDITGFAQANTIFSPEPPDDINESRPTIFSPNPNDPICDGGFRNLYFPHVEEDTELGRQLQRTFMPYGDAGFDNLQGRGLYNTEFCDLTNSLANPGDYLRPEYPTSTSPKVIAPRATIDPFATREYRDQYDIQGNLNYDGTFTCTFYRTFTPPATTEGVHTNLSCDPANPGDVWCNTTECQQYTCAADEYWIGPQGCGVCYNWEDTTADPNSPERFPCRQNPACIGAESWTTCSITAADTTSLYIAMPRTEELWERFVIGDMSIVRKIFPRLGPDRPIVEFQDVPAYTFATYSSRTGPGATSGSTTVGNPSTGNRGSAGTPLTGEIYFPHLGSINTYFLKEVQRALRPKELGGYIEPGHPPPTDTACSTKAVDITPPDISTPTPPGNCLNIYVNPQESQQYAAEIRNALSYQQTHFNTSSVQGWAHYFSGIFTGWGLNWTNPQDLTYQHLFHECCGVTPCYDYLITKTLNQSHLNPYLTAAIALSENGGLLTTDPYARDIKHFGCDPFGTSSYGYGIDIGDKSRCMLNTFNMYQGDGANEALIRYGFTAGVYDTRLRDIIQLLSENRYSGLCPVQ